MSIQSEITRLETAKSDIASAIGAKGVTVPNGTKLDGMASLIEDIEAAANPVLQTKTVTPTTAVQNVTPDSGYDGLSKVTVNAMPTATQATPSIFVDANGKITASATQTAGYVSAGTKSATKQLTIQAAKTVTPTTSSQTAVAKDRYTTGAVTVAGDANLVAGNIKSGVSIFGVAGNYEGSGGGGGSGGGLEELSTTITDNGMSEPGLNEYILDVPGLNSSTRTLVIVTCDRHSGASSTSAKIAMFVFQRNNLTDPFTFYVGELESVGAISTIQLNENSITLYGTNLDANTSSLRKTYIVYAC